MVCSKANTCNYKSVKYIKKNASLGKLQPQEMPVSQERKKDFELVSFTEFFLCTYHIVLSEKMDVETLNMHVHA